MSTFDNILVIGGGGYVGAVLVPKLLSLGYKVKVYDLMIYGQEVFESVKNHPNLSFIKQINLSFCFCCYPSWDYCLADYRCRRLSFYPLFSIVWFSCF